MVMYRVTPDEKRDWQESVINIVNDPPSSPNRGDRYIVGPSPTGTFASHKDDIAWCDDASIPSWQFDTPQTGWRTYVKFNGIDYNFDGTSWSVSSSSVDEKVKASSTDTAGYLDSKMDDTTVEVNASNKVQVKDLGITNSKLANDSVDENKINSTAISNGLQGGSGTPISVKEDTIGGSNLADVINVSSNGVAVRIDNDTIQENSSNQLSVGANSIGPDEIDETNNYTWTGLNDFTNGTITVPTPSNGNDAVNLDYVTGLFNGLDWQESILNIQTDNTLDPGSSPNTGDRYILTNVSNLNSNFGTITGVGDNDIVEYDGSNFVVVYDVSTNTEGGATWNENDNIQYVFNGTSWVTLSGTVQHNSLAGLQGGTTNEYYHLSLTVYNALTGAAGVVNASTYHIHDDRYYTETELSSTVNDSSGSSLIGTPTLSNLGNSTNVEDALEYINDNIDSLGQDEKIKVSSNDTTEGYLNGKLIGTANKITLTENNDGGDETLQINIGSNIFDKTSDALDDISDGPSVYAKVKATELQGGVNGAGTVHRLNDGTNTVSALEGKTAYSRRAQYDSGLEALIFDLTL